MEEIHNLGQNMEEGSSNYNLRTHSTQKRQPGNPGNSSNKQNLAISQDVAPVQSSHRQQCATGGDMNDTGGSPRGCVAGTSSSEHAATTPLPLERDLANSMSEMRASFSQLNGKIDTVINDIAMCIMWCLEK